MITLSVCALSSCVQLGSKGFLESEKQTKIKRQNDRKTERQKDRKTDGHMDRETERQNYRNVCSRRHLVYLLNTNYG
jgi:hypothetical protein